ncbi:peptidoglycan DD-metalloendopeptidase family protein [Arenimonas fontis]|uniref:Peptidoglycan DD-metalloendopeptidase family protein n=1 Tax=Arenimonas fontis TaxID=2608255 RepID=A0A5B2ZCN1_9GAMM|nr:peptidoglycan DD-metalloendopeptidase family protein [Arenimonas fontis]KAA2285757.1 peptidoglycan DD-metalloendopeptidase family protein [Arenimonas fontis]
MSTFVARAALVSLLVSLLVACGHARVVKREGVRPVTAADRGSLEVPQDGRYTVRKGDTLYGIAFRHGLDYREVAAWNGIRAPYTIYPGQRLLLRGREQAREVAVTPAPPATTPGAPVTGPTMAGTPPGDTAQQGRPPATSPAPQVTRPAPPATPPATPAPVPAGAPSGWQWPTQGQIVGRFVAGDPKRQGLDIAGQAGQPVLAAAPGVVVYSGAGLVGYGELIIVKHSDEWLSAYAHNRRRLVAEGEQVRAGQQIAELGRTGTSRDMLHFEIRRNGKPVDPLGLLPPR